MSDVLRPHQSKVLLIGYSLLGAKMENKIHQLNKRVNHPLSPGEVVGGILEKEQITQAQAADHLGISRTCGGK